MHFTNNIITGQKAEENRSGKMADQKLIQLLNQALEAEYQASMQYLQHYNNVRSMYTGLVDHFKEHMDDEHKHANELCSRIYMLGGVPSTNVNPPPAEFTDDVDEALKQDIIAEQQAIDLYSEILKYTESVSDYATTMMIEGILADEVHHVDEFAKFKRTRVARG